MSLTKLEKLELFRYFFDTDYRQHLLDHGNSITMVNQYINSKIQRVDAATFNVDSWYETLSPHCLSMFPELKEFFEDNDEA